ncbi:MAG: hypothetical protein II864_08160, partial [Prevotella sp.]|nr:hypothetical protein [Prevotella sp.]
TDVTEKILINVMGALLSSLPGSVQRKTGKGKVANRVHSISTSQYEKFSREFRGYPPGKLKEVAGLTQNSLENFRRCHRL